MKSLIVVPNRCTGCHRCEMSCSFVHFKTMNPSKSAIHVIRVDHAPIDAPIFCVQCGLCIDVCPAKAISRNNKTQAVVVDYEKCTGCGNCVNVCPYGAVTVDPVTKKAIKCDLCGGNPECVKICPESVLQYLESNAASHYKRMTYANLQRMELKPLIPYPRKG